MTNPGAKSTAEPIRSNAQAGSKAALFVGRDLITYRRDRKPDIPFPGLWDLPGGGREGHETPLACIRREVHEELGLCVASERFNLFQHPSMQPVPGSMFFVAVLTTQEWAAATCGTEGEDWRLMPALDFVQRQDAVPHLRRYVAAYLQKTVAQRDD